MNVDFLIWIPLLPLIGAALNLTLGHGLSRRKVHLIGCGSVFAALLVSLYAVFGVLQPVIGQALVDQGIALHQQVYTWMAIGNLSISVAFSLDALSAVMILVITFVGFLIHLYSVGYMHHDPDGARFFGYLNLFTGAMLILVLGDSLPVLFVGWEGVGLCSYLLIGFWYDKDGTQRQGSANASAGKKAFIVNRIGDFAFLLGIFLLFSRTGTLRIAELAGKVSALLEPLNPALLGSVTVAGAVALLLFIGACGKSAQIPLYVWLPDAMAGPTPVSALIHAATMVTAGVYMVARLNVLFMLTPWVMGLVALVGALTAVFAATIGFTQRDIKKVLAYSTVSQLGYMFMGVGVGAFAAGVFHLFTHAFFKACLFLGAGAVIHALREEQDIFKMGGLAKKLPITRLTFLVATLAIAGFPLLAGFFSKDEILWHVVTSHNPAWGPHFSATLYWLGLIGAFCTAFYMFRLYTLTFSGTSRLDADTLAQAHEAPRSMTVPLIVLASGAAILGWLGMPAVFGPNLFDHHWLAPVVDRGRDLAQHHGFATVTVLDAVYHDHAREWLSMGLSVVIAGVGIVGAVWLYRPGLSAAAGWSKRLGPFYRASLAKYWVDEIYHVLFVLPFRGMAWLMFRFVDRAVIDILGVGGTSFITDFVGRRLRSLATGHVQQYVAVLVIGVAVILYLARSP